MKTSGPVHVARPAQATQQAQATRAVSGLVVCFTESEQVCERSAGLICVPGGTIDEREASGKGLSVARSADSEGD